ncbi:hypothetical protein EDB85DRAFT_1894199 [Lactarius pseudohatsudake]|nr:hypothetical protein EDB85DRAFT_1894199 [Lactarius pseudohatsudake]
MAGKIDIPPDLLKTIEVVTFRSEVREESTYMSQTAKGNPSLPPVPPAAPLQSLLWPRSSSLLRHCLTVVAVAAVVPQQREEGDHNGTKEGAWCSSSSSPLRGGVTSGAVWIATDYGRETTGTASVLLTGSPISPRRTPILPPQRTAPPLLLPPRGQPSPYQPKSCSKGHHDDSKNNLAPFVKAFPPSEWTSEEATELSSTSLNDEQVYTTSLAKHPTSLRSYPNRYPAWTPNHATPSSPPITTAQPE